MRQPRVLDEDVLHYEPVVVLDPFMGSGSTLAAASAIDYDSIGIEMDKHYLAAARTAIPLLAALYPKFLGDSLNLELAGGPTIKVQSGDLQASLFA